MILGLTGGIASGKSLASNYFKQLGYPVIDADLVSREVVEPGTKGLGQIVQAFGKDILDETGALNRAKLGDIVFSDPAKRQTLNDITHPLIWETISERLDAYKKEGHDLIVLDIPLLFESNRKNVYDHIMVIHIPTEIQLDRLMKRNKLTEKQAQERIQSQMSLDEKAERADTIIDNSGTKAQTYQQIDDWLDQQKT